MQFEGLRLARYIDATGHATIGYGHLITPHDPPFGTLTQAAAEELLEFDLGAHAADLCIELGDAVISALTDGMYGALVDFVFNLGIGQFTTSTMCHLIKHGYQKQAADEFPKWVYGRVNGSMQVLPGLVKRRDAERAMYLS